MPPVTSLAPYTPPTAPTASHSSTNIPMTRTSLTSCGTPGPSQPLCDNWGVNFAAYSPTGGELALPGSWCLDCGFGGGSNNSQESGSSNGLLNALASDTEGEASLGAEIDAELAPEARQPFDIVEYGDKVPGFQNHHGVLDVWAKNNITGYVSREDTGPAIALTDAQHEATKAVYRQWLFDLTGKYIGGSVDWTTISARDMQELSESMFDAAGVPDEARQAYYEAFYRYIYRLL